mmetsp:Transcript_32727/g.63258  ORF Transcript_32727/g.63258 Transcript_32727/m.63258 type:complete len:97 (+) Transcript_32727:3-293(+)
MTWACRKNLGFLGRRNRFCGHKNAQETSYSSAISTADVLFCSLWVLDDSGAQLTDRRRARGVVLDRGVGISSKMPETGSDLFICTVLDDSGAQPSG